jgi:hypothetical protein
MTPTVRIALLQAALRELRDQAAAVHTRLDLRLDVPPRLLASLLAACNHADLVLGGPPSVPAGAPPQAAETKPALPNAEAAG